MDSIDERLKDISEIRALMEQSSRFLSLSGLSGISAGAVGLGAVVIALFHADQSASKESQVSFYGTEALITLILALSLAAYFSLRMARKKELPVWTNITKSLLIHLFIPLAAGGIFCLVLLYHDISLLIAPSMLIFYGLALLNASKYTLKEIRYLGVSEICLGLIASFWIQYALILWGAGFGVLHIAYGTFMYFKYEK